MSVPSVDWERVAGRIQRRIIQPPDVNPHIVALAQTGSGKDHMIRWGILPFVPFSRVVVLITKNGGDRTWEGWGNILAGPGDLKPGFGRGPDGTPRYVVPLPPGRVKRDEVQRLLAQLSAEGEAIVVIGDAARLSSRERDGGLALERDVSNMMIEGREVGLTVIACANSASWAAGGIKEQPAAVLIGRTGGELAHDFLQIADLDPRERGPYRQALSALPPHSWLYSDHADGPPLAGIATPPPAGWISEAWESAT